jgi:hypothetical protein
MLAEDEVVQAVHILWLQLCENGVCGKDNTVLSRYPHSLPVVSVTHDWLGSYEMEHYRNKKFLHSMMRCSFLPTLGMNQPFIQHIHCIHHPPSSWPLGSCLGYQINHQWRYHSDYAQVPYCCFTVPPPPNSLQLSFFSSYRAWCHLTLSREGWVQYSKISWEGETTFT